MKKRVNLLITDLDDTLWDWLHMWHTSFKSYLDAISESTGIESAQLVNDFKKIHQKYGSSECSYAYKELESIKSDHVRIIEDDSKGPSIIQKYHEDKVTSLKLYDDVFETLQQLKKMGIKIVGFTESNLSYTKQRIKVLGLDGILDCIYANEDHVIPETTIRYLGKDFCDILFTQFITLPTGIKKPNPDFLLRIIKEMGGNISNTIYIGDKLFKDIYMANMATVTSVHTDYNHIIDDDLYELLNKVTHWSDEKVQEEIEIKNNKKEIRISPSYTINSFKNILELFDFFEHVSTK